VHGPGAPGVQGAIVSPGAIRYRRATEADLDACTRIWKSGIDDYQGRLNQPPMPGELGPLRRLLAHALGTDPDRFWVASREPRAGEAGRHERGGDCLGFGSATIRGDLWFLAMLFVEPGQQAAGIGSALLDRTLVGCDPEAAAPAHVSAADPAAAGTVTPVARWGTCTDAAQPISNALYARRGIVPRLPVWRMVGEIRHPSAIPALPGSLETVSFEAIAEGAPDGHRRLAEVVNELDRSLLGIEHGRDHAYLRREGRSGLLVRERNGRAIGYGYASGVGRVGPVAALDPDLMPAILGAVIRETPAPGPIATWVPGSATAATRALLHAGLRFEGFPGLICWSDGPMPFERYLPISLALI
jgi:GNAT superfamily N-acetyltransferase